MNDLNKLNDVARHSVSGYGRQDICYNDPEGDFVFYSDYKSLEQRTEAAERERDELRAEQAEHDEQIARMDGKFNLAKRALDSKTERCDKAEAELARRDAAAGERVKAVVKHYAGCKYPLIKVNSLEVVIAGEREDAEELAEFINTIGAPPAVLPPKKVRWFMVDGQRVFDEKAEGWNDCIDESARLGAQPQKAVELPSNIRTELVNILTWIERLPVPTISAAAKAIRLRKVISDIDAANVPYEVKK